MMVNFLIFHTLFSIILIVICKNFNILADKKIEKHKKYSTKINSHLIGGLLIVLFLGYYHFSIVEKPLLNLFLLLIFFIGFMADTRSINSVSQRFLLQLIVVVCFVNILNIEINYTKMKFFDELLENQLINIFFVSFCLLVLINGTNFIDGLNGIVLVYYLIVFLIILLNLNHLIFDKVLLLNIIFVLTILLVLNFLGLIYLGDSGSYTLSLFSGIFLITLVSNNGSISPYLIIVLLWYPCFELLFSIIRRYFKDVKTYKPDTTHLHQLIYKKVVINFKVNNNLISHLISNLIINLYNLVCFIVATKYIYNSDILIFILAINIFLYLILYSFLKK